MGLGGRGGVSNSHGAQKFPAPAVFDQLMGCLTLLGRPSRVTQNDNTHRELGFFFQKKKKDLVMQRCVLQHLFSKRTMWKGA